MSVGWRGVWLALAAAAVLSGCSSRSYDLLRDEDAIPELAALKQRTMACTNHTVRIHTHGVRERGPVIHVAVHQFECADHTGLLVFLHGVFSDSSAWRYIAGDLASDHDLWLVDLPGCGLSDKPDPDRLGPDGYSPVDLTARVLEALQDRLRERPADQRFSIVGHSLGAMLALRMFADDGLRERFAPVLERIDRIIVSSPVDVELHRPDPFFEEIATISGLEIRIGTALGLIRERVAAGTLESVDDPAHRAIRQEADQRVSFLNDGPTRRAMQAMLKKAVAWKGRRPDWERNQAVVAGYRFVKPDVLILWGDRDEVLPIAMGYKLAVQLPHAKLLPLARVMHSPHLELPDVTARIIREFADKGTVPTLPDPGSMPPPASGIKP